MDTYTATRDQQDALFAGMDLDLLRIIPPRAYIPIEGEEDVTPDGRRIVVDRVTQRESGICVAGTLIGKQKSGRYKPKTGTSNTCYLFRFVPFPPVETA